MWKRKGGRLRRKRLYGSHSARRGGAQALARAGVLRDLIKLWGRWRSNAVDVYLEEAALRAAEQTIAEAMVTDKEQM